MPREGLWKSWESYCDKKATKISTLEPIVDVKATNDTPLQSGAPRTRVDNTPASPQNIEELKALPKPPSTPSVTVSPLPISQIIPKLRWSNIGHFYHWGTKSYHFDPSYTPVPSDIHSLCQQAVKAVKWRDVWGNGADITAGAWETETPNWLTWEEEFGTFRPLYRVYVELK